MNCNYALKLESKTTIKFTPTQDGVVKIGLSSSGNNNLKWNGTKVSGNDQYVVEQEVTTGTEYTITKADVAYIFYIDLVYGESGGQGGDDPQPSEPTSAKVWDFTQPLSSNDLANLEEDCEEVESEGATSSKNWYKLITKIDNNNVSRYGNGKKLADKNVFTALSANGQALESTLGLMFARNGNALSTKNVRIDAGYRLSLNGGKIQIKIPGLKAGDIVYVDYASANSTSERTLTVTNGEGKNLSSTVRTIAKITVSKDGDLVLQQSDGMYYYKIYVNPTEVPTGINAINTESIKADSVLYDLMGRKVTKPVSGQLYIQNGKKFIYK